MKTQLEAIRAIVPSAAEYIENEVIPKYPKDKLDDILKSKKKLFRKKKPPKFELLDLFVWELTPMGWHYWLKIWSQLNGVKNESSSNLGKLYFTESTD